MIINVTGMKGSGKTTALNYFDKLGFDAYEIYGEYNRLKENDCLSEDEKGQEGVWDETRVKAVDNHVLNKYRYYLTFLGGLLRPGELEYIKSVDNVYTINVEGGDVSKRFERIKNRSRDNEGSYSLKDLIRRDENRLGLTKGYEDNDIAYIMSDSVIDIDNTNDEDSFKKNLYNSLVELGSVIQNGSDWYNKNNKYLDINNQILFTIEGLLGNRKRVLDLIPTVSSSLSIGCGLGSELDLISAYSKKGVDLLPEHYFNQRSFDYENCDFRDVKDDAELVTMLRTASTKSEKSDSDIEFAVGKAGRYLLLSYARAGIMSDGTIKKFNHSTDGRPIGELLDDTYKKLSEHGRVFNFNSNFESFYLLDKKK